MSDNLPERYLTNADIDLMTRIAKAYAMSGLFEDIKGEIQAWIKVSAGRELGLLPFQAMNSIDIIKGKPVLNSNFLASCVKSHERYDYRVQTLDNDQAVISFFEDGVEIGVSRFDQADATAAGLAGGRGDMYQKYARNMLFARALSNGVAWFCPDVINARVYLEGEVDVPAERPQQIDGPAATMPEAENVIDVEPEMDTAVKEPMTGTASATIDPETIDQKTATGISVAQAALARESEALAEREAIAAAQREAAKAPEQVAHEAQQASDMADAMHSAREAEVAAQETFTPGGEPPFGGDEPLPPPGTKADPPLTPDEQKELGWTDADKVAAIGRLFNPNDPNALPTDIRLKVKRACEILEIWDKNTPQALFLLFGDAAMTSKGLEEGLAKALDEQKARKDAEKVAAAEKPVQAPEEGLSSVASALKSQDAKVAQVLGVLNGLTKDQAATLSDLLAAQGQPADATPETMAKELWLGYGPASLSADTLLAALDSPPWASGPA